MLLLGATLVALIAGMIGFMFIDEKLNWHDNRRMSPEERGTRKLIYDNPFLESMLIEHGLLPANG